MTTRESRTAPSAPAPEPALFWALPSSLPGFDIDGARNRLGGNATLLADLLQAFATEHAGCAEQVDALLHDERPATAAAALHRLKSAARIVGAQALAQAAEKLESDIRHGRLIDTTAFGGALADAVRHIATHLSATRGDPPSGRSSQNRS